MYQKLRDAGAEKIQNADVDRTKTSLDSAPATGQHAPTPRESDPPGPPQPSAPGYASTRAPATPPDREWSDNKDDSAEAADLFGTEEDLDDTTEFA